MPHLSHGCAVGSGLRAELVAGPVPAGPRSAQTRAGAGRGRPDEFRGRGGARRGAAWPAAHADVLSQHRDLPRRRARVSRGSRCCSSCRGRATPGAAGQARSRWWRRCRGRRCVGAAMAGGVDGPLRLGHWVMFARDLAVVAGRDAARGVRRVAAAAGGGLRRRRDAVLRARQRDPGHPARAGAQLAGAGVDGIRRRAARRRGGACGMRSTRARRCAPTCCARSSATGRGGGAVRRAGADRYGGDRSSSTALTVLLFTSLAIAIAINVLADPLAGLLDRLAFSRSPALRADRAALRRTEAALPLRSANPLDDVDDDTFVRLTRRALGHYGDLSKLVASPLTALPDIDERLAARGAPDQPLERANELKALLADRIAAAQAARRRRLRHHRAVAPLQRAVLPVRRRCAGVCAERDRRRAGSGRPPGVAVVRHRGAAAVAAQLAERRRPADRRRSARQSGARDAKTV